MKLAIIVMNLDSYKRKINTKSSFIYNEDDEFKNNEFKVSKVMSKRITREKFKYLFK